MSLYLQLRGVGDGRTYNDGDISRTHYKEIHARVLSLQGDIGANEKKYDAEVIFLPLIFIQPFIYHLLLHIFTFVCEGM